jgi:hypothetical protein
VLSTIQKIFSGDFIVEDDTSVRGTGAFMDVTELHTARSGWQRSPLAKSQKLSLEA